MTEAMPLLVLSASLVTAIVIFLLDEAQQRLRTAVNLAGAVAKLALVIVMLDGVARGVVYETHLTLLPELELLFRVDALALLFLTLSAFLWLLTTLYAISYLGDGPDLSRFFGFFSLCVAATAGIAVSGTLMPRFSSAVPGRFIDFVEQRSEHWPVVGPVLIIIVLIGAALL